MSLIVFCEVSNRPVGSWRTADIGESCPGDGAYFKARRKLMDVCGIVCNFSERAALNGTFDEYLIEVWRMVTCFLEVVAIIGLVSMMGRDLAQVL